jgi:hypothetical protein
MEEHRLGGEPGPEGHGAPGLAGICALCMISFSTNITVAEDMLP